MFQEEFVPLTPVNFFALNADCRYAEWDSKADLGNKFLLPDTSGICDERSFAKVWLAWGYKGIFVQVKVDAPVSKVEYPEVSQGDSVELFFDTRDVKTSGWNTRFCHHFFFLPEAVEGHQAGEKTHFRTEDVHELCQAQDLKVQASIKSSSYSLKIFVPSHCLYGYDPEQFNRLGFTYRINRFDGSSQHFSVVTNDYQIEQQPSLWSSLRLINENSTIR